MSLIFILQQCSLMQLNDSGILIVLKAPVGWGTLSWLLWTVWWMTDMSIHGWYTVHSYL